MAGFFIFLCFARFMKKFVAILLLFVPLLAQWALAQSLLPNEKNRVIVTTDLGGADPDDIQSMIHLLVCSNVYDIEGLISSQAWVTDPDRTGKVREVVECFGEVLPRLKKHDPGYPDLDYLRSIVKRGQAVSNMDGVGEGKDSPGSELIIAAVDKKGDNRPVWLTAWGGMNTIAQAIWKVKHTRGESELKRFLGKIRIYDILGQDDAGAWIAHNFPDILYIRNKHVYGWPPSDEWIKGHIQCHGSLGKVYPNRIWATEGDSPAFLYLYANGLNVPDSVDYGGWGGRFSKEKQSGLRGMDFIEKSGKDETQYDPYYMYVSAPEGVQAINKWQRHIWNDFEARMRWAATDRFEAANHHPVAIVNGERSLRCLYVDAKAGETLTFDASQSEDVDNDNLSYNWSVYAEPSTYKDKVAVKSGKLPLCHVAVPHDASGKTIHLILEVTDDGTPNLTAYKRIVLRVR